MRLFWWEEGQDRLWLAPALLGLLLILLGVLLYKHPELLAYFVAGVFVLVGSGLIVSAWRMRRRVTYRQINREWEIHEPRDDAPDR